MSSLLFEALGDEGGGGGGGRTLAEYWGVPSAADAIDTMAADPASQAGKVVKAKAKRKVLIHSLSPTFFLRLTSRLPQPPAADLFPSVSRPPHKRA